jgi:16S rRNA (uracil1498-N3)-methyltransferase
MRIYSASKNISEGKIIINDIEQIHYLKDVLRLKISCTITVFDEKGNEYKATIEQISSKNLSLKILNRLAHEQAMGIRLAIACAIPKKSKFDDIVDKLTQLGVDRIIPLITERVIVKIDRQKAAGRKQRWEKIALAASQQSQRNTVPVIDSVKDFKSALAETKDFDLKLIPTLPGERKSLKEKLEGEKYKNIIVFIGPEGDFTPEEVALAEKAGFIPVSLGESVLRVETAAVAVASFIRFLDPFQLK